MFTRKNSIDVLIFVMTIAMLVTSALLAGQVRNTFGFGKSIVEKEKKGHAALPADENSVIGKIIAITDSVITVQSLFSASTTWSISIDATTLFQREVLKDRETFEREVTAFNARIKTVEADALGNPPVPFSFQEISFADFHIGSFVMAVAAQDARSLTEFVAKRIIIAPNS